MVSAGFDAHRRDPLGGMGVSEAGFAAIAHRLVALAEKFAGARIAFLLEGGYDLAALKNSVAAVLGAMQEASLQSGAHLKLSESRIEPLVRRILQTHENYNNLKSY